MTQTPEWHAERSTGIGASDMNDLFSLPSPYTTLPQAGGCARRLWYDKSGVARDFPRITNAAMQRGTDCEDIVARKLADLTGWRITRRHQMLRHPEIPHLIAHVDREATIPRPTGHAVYGARIAVELKTMRDTVVRKVTKVGLSDGYLLQMQAILLAGAGRYARGVFGCLNVDTWEMLPPIIIEHDYEVQQRIRDRAGWLWAQVNLKLNMEPRQHPGHGPTKLASIDPRCSECCWRRTCQGLQDERDVEAARDTLHTMGGS